MREAALNLVQFVPVAVCVVAFIAALEALF